MKMLILTGLGIIAAVPVQAQVRASDPQTIVRAVQDAGYKAELTKDSGGDPMIRSGASGYKFTIFFLNCEKNRDCADIQFYAGWTDKLSPERANEWNSKHRFARGYSDDQGEACLEYDINFEDQALPAALFKKDLDLWESLMAKFINFVTEEPTKAP